MIRGTSLLCTIHIPLISIVPPTKKIISSYTNVEAVIFNLIILYALIKLFPSSHP